MRVMAVLLISTRDFYCLVNIKMMSPSYCLTGFPLKVVEAFYG